MKKKEIGWVRMRASLPRKILELGGADRGGDTGCRGVVAMRVAELIYTKLQNSKLLQILISSTFVIAVGIAIGSVVVTQGMLFKMILVGVGALFVSFFILRRNLTINVITLQKGLLYLTIAAGFVGAALFTTNIGPFHLFPYRILLLLLWVLFIITFLLKQGRLNTSHIKVKFYLQFLAIWLLYAVLSLAWAPAKDEAIRNIIFLFMAVSIIFFVVYYLSDISSLKRFYYLWLLVFVVLIPIGVWETFTGKHLSVSVLAQTTHPKARFMPTTVFHNTNDYATYLALSLPFIFALIRYHGRFMIRFLGGLVLIAGLYLLLATFSRANYLAVFIGVVFWLTFLLRFKGKIKALTVVGLAVVSFLVLFPDQVQYVFNIISAQLSTLVVAQSYSEDNSLVIRLDLFRNILIFLIDSFGFGVGAGNIEYYMTNFQVYDTRGILKVHNWWLEILANYGLFIFIGYVIFYLSLAINLYKVYRKLTNTSEKMICEGLLVGLVAVFPFATMSTSSLMAFRPQWLFLVFALAFLNYWRIKEARGRI